MTRYSATRSEWTSPDLDTSYMEEPLLMGKESDKHKYKSKVSSRATLQRKLKILTVAVFLLTIILIILTVGATITLLLHEDKVVVGPVIPACSIDGSDCVGYRQNFKKAAIASDHPTCSEIGKVILSERGGNVVDAGIATLICLGVANIQSAGVGGGGFFLYYEHAQNKSYLVNARERAPIKAFKDMYKHDFNASEEGGLAIAVPGEIAGYHALHSKFGKLAWADLFTPTIKLCQDGIPVGSGLDLAIQHKREKIFQHEGLKEMLVNPATGDVYHTGDIIKFPKLAATLKRIADGGVQEYYNGSLAKDIVDDIADAGGIITREDLQTYKTEIEDPLVIKLSDGNTLFAVPPPSSGSLVGLVYNVMADYKWRTDTLSCQKASVLFHQRLTEAWKYAYAIRFRLGDQDYVDVKKLMANVTSQEFASYLREQIDDNRTFDPEHYGPVKEPVDDHGTTHLSILDMNGDAFAATTSINEYFGSKIVGKRTGIVFDDTMDDFSIPGKPNSFNIPPSKANYIVPGKRPMSTMTPSIVMDQGGDIVMVVGASGGSKILTATTYVMIRTLLLNDDLKMAVDAPRIHHQWIPNYITYEFEVENYLLDGLAAKGHKMVQQPKDERGAVVQGLLRSFIQAYCDVRKGGCPAGVN